MASRSPDPITPEQLNALILRIAKAKSRKRRLRRIDRLVTHAYRSPRILHIFNQLSQLPQGHMLAIEFAARMPVPVPNGVLLLAAPLLQEKAVPLSSRLAAAGKLVASLPDRTDSIGPILRSLTAGLTKQRTLERLLQLQSRVVKSEALDSVVAGLEATVKYRCPRCNRTFTRPSLVRHLWKSHRLLFDFGHILEPGPRIEAAVADALQKQQATAIDRVYDWAEQLYPGVDPCQVHQAIMSRSGATPEDLDSLLEVAGQRGFGLCSACYSMVPPSIPPLPPPLILTNRTLSGSGYRIELQERLTGRRLTIADAEGVYLRQGDPGGRIAPRQVASFAILPVALAGMALATMAPVTLMKPIVVNFLVISAATLIYAGVLFLRRSLPQARDRVVDAAWREIAPKIGRSPQAIEYLTRLCRVSLGQGSFGERSERVWELVEHAAVLADKGPAYQQWLACTRVLQAWDSTTLGQDWVLSLIDIAIPFFRGEASPIYIEAFAETVLDAPTLRDRDTARLRVLLAVAAFENGFTPTDLALLAPACPRLFRLLPQLDGDVQLLYAVWTMRHARAWERTVGPADFVGEYARTSPSASGRLLQAVPDALLIQTPDGPIADELGAIVVATRGVIIGGVVSPDPATQVSAEKGKSGNWILRLGSQRITVSRKIPDQLIRDLQGWFQFRAQLLRDKTAEVSRVADRLRYLIQAGTSQCPLCSTRSIIRVGQLGLQPER